MVDRRDTRRKLHGDMRPLDKVHIGLLGEGENQPEVVGEPDPNTVHKNDRQGVLRGIAGSSMRAASGCAARC